MEGREERLDEQQLRTLSTGDLVRHALDEAKLLVKAEVLYAKEELKSELKAAKLAGILTGAALAFALCGLSLLFVAVAVALPMREPLAALLVGGVLLILAGGAGFAAFKSIPHKPLPKTQERLKKDFALTRETLQ